MLFSVSKNEEKECRCIHFEKGEELKIIFSVPATGRLKRIKFTVDEIVKKVRENFVNGDLEITYKIREDVNEKLLIVYVVTFEVTAKTNQTCFQKTKNEMLLIINYLILQLEEIVDVKYPKQIILRNEFSGEIPEYDFLDFDTLMNGMGYNRIYPRSNNFFLCLNDFNVGINIGDFNGNYVFSCICGEIDSIKIVEILNKMFEKMLKFHNEELPKIIDFY